MSSAPITSPLQFDINTDTALFDIRNFAQNQKKSEIDHDYQFGRVHFHLSISTNETAIKDGRFSPHISQLEKVGWEILSEDITKGCIKYHFHQCVETQNWIDFVEDHTLKQLASTYNYIEGKIRELERKHSLSAMSLRQVQDVYRIATSLREYESAMMKHQRLEALCKKISSIRSINKTSVPYALLDLYSDLKVENERKDRVMVMYVPLTIIKWCISCLLDPSVKECPPCSDNWKKN